MSIKNLSCEWHIVNIWWYVNWSRMQVFWWSVVVILFWLTFLKWEHPHLDVVHRNINDIDSSFRESFGLKRNRKESTQATNDSKQENGFWISFWFYALIFFSLFFLSLSPSFSFSLSYTLLMWLQYYLICVNFHSIEMLTKTKKKKKNGNNPKKKSSKKKRK